MYFLFSLNDWYYHFWTNSFCLMLALIYWYYLFWAYSICFMLYLNYGYYLFLGRSHAVYVSWWVIVVELQLYTGSVERQTSKEKGHEINVLD